MSESVQQEQEQRTMEGWGAEAVVRSRETIVGTT